MRRLVRLFSPLAGVGLCSLLAQAPAFGAFLPTVTVDENCNGTFDNGLTTTKLACTTTGGDPSGALTNAMVYTLPYPLLGQGDVQINEAVAVAVVPSDVIRFLSVPGVGNFLIFYSDQDGGIDAPADTGLPRSLSTNLVQLNEVALPGGGFGAVYSPATTASPGGRDGAVQYTFISDTSVPEPSTMALGAIGFGLIAIARRRRRTS